MSYYTGPQSVVRHRSPSKSNHSSIVWKFHEYSFKCFNKWNWQQIETSL